MARTRSGCWGLKSISCTVLLFSYKSGQRDEFCGLVANATILTVVWVGIKERGSSMCSQQPERC